MLILHVTYTAKAGMARNFIADLEAGPAPMVRAEKGNICYDYYLSSADENTVLLLEKWEDDAALAAHMNMPHMADVRAIKEKYIDNTAIEKYSV